MTTNLLIGRIVTVRINETAKVEYNLLMSDEDTTNAFIGEDINGNLRSIKLNEIVRVWVPEDTRNHLREFAHLRRQGEGVAVIKPQAPKCKLNALELIVLAATQEMNEEHRKQAATQAGSRKDQV